MTPLESREGHKKEGHVRASRTLLITAIRKVAEIAGMPIPERKMRSEVTLIYSLRSREVPERLLGSRRKAGGRGQEAHRLAYCAGISAGRRADRARGWPRRHPSL